MKIGIDAKWFFTGPVSTRVILYNLLPELFAHYPMHEWHLFLDKKDRPLDFPYKQDNIHLHYVWAGMNLFSNLFVVPRKAKQVQVDVMVYQTFPSLNKSIPTIAFIHDVLFRDFPQFFTWKERLYFTPLPYLVQNNTRLIATTETVANDLLKYSYSTNRSHIDIVPLGIASSFKPAEQHDKYLLNKVKAKFQLPHDFILFVGRLNVRKNIEHLLKALPLLQNKNISLVIVGKEDWKAPNIKTLLAGPAIQNRILLTGGMTDEELTATYAMAKLFCFPSYAEGFGIPPLEAMASGIPVIVSDTTSLPEVCGEAATYINPHEPASIANAINTLLNEPGLYAMKKNQGLQQAARYTWTKTAHAFMKSITNTLENYTA